MPREDNPPRRDDVAQMRAELAGAPPVEGVVAFDLDVWRERCAGGVMPRETARIGEARTAGGVSVIPLRGVIRPHGFEGFFGSVPGLDHFMKRFRAARDDEAIGAILIPVSSPGGLIDGVEEAATEIYEARAIKPIWAVADHYAASAAYWIASSAERFYVSPSGDVGSIGVMAVHANRQKMCEQIGVEYTYITSDPYKAEINPTSPLDEAALAHMQSRVDARALQFRKTVARNRGVTEKVVRETFGQGRLVLAADAVKAGMVDGIMSLEQAITKLGAARRPAPARRVRASMPDALSARARMTFASARR